MTYKDCVASNSFKVEISSSFILNSLRIVVNCAVIKNISECSQFGYKPF